jgi:hypothetical protein
VHQVRLTIVHQGGINSTNKGYKLERASWKISL